MPLNWYILHPHSFSCGFSHSFDGFSQPATGGSGTLALHMQPGSSAQPPCCMRAEVNELSHGMSASQPVIHISVFLVTSRFMEGSRIRSAVSWVPAAVIVISGLSMFILPPRVN